MYSRSRSTRYGDKIVRKGLVLGVTLFQRVAQVAQHVISTCTRSGVNIQQISPQSPEELARMLAITEGRPNSRRFFTGVHALTGGGDPFLLAATGEIARYYRQALLINLKPDKFASALAPLLDQLLDKYGVALFSEVNIVDELLQVMTLEALFDIKDRELSRQGALILNKVKERGKIDPFNLREDQAVKMEYSRWVDRLFSAHAHEILSQLRSYPEVQLNFLTYLLLEEIKAAHPELASQTDLKHFLSEFPPDSLEKYLKDKNFKSLPAVLLAVNNLNKVAINMGRLAIQALRNEREAPDIDRLIGQSLVMEKGKTLKIRRYAETALVLGTKRIAANTLVEFATNPATIFSAGPRRCPAAYAIFKPIMQTIYICMERYQKRCLHPAAAQVGRGRSSLSPFLA